MKFTRKTFNFTDETILMLEDLKKLKGFPDDTSIARFCISEVHSREMRNEVRVKKVSGVDDKLDIDERRKEREIERCKKLAEKLEATLIPNGDTFDVEYFTHSKHGSFRQVLPLLSLTDELVAKQWFPSRQIIEEYRKINKDKK